MSKIHTILFFYLLLTSLNNLPSSSHSPTPWPLQFHSILFMNTSNTLSLVDLWYDWPNGRNFNIIRDQLDGPTFYDLEWNNGTVFKYYLEPPLSCTTFQLDVGVLRPDWLSGATYVGRESVGGFVCDVWTKVEFIWYYEDVETGRPVKWVFYTGRTIHVMTFEEGAVLEDDKWQAPVYCFEKNSKSQETEFDVVDTLQEVQKRSDIFHRALFTSK